MADRLIYWQQGYICLSHISNNIIEQETCIFQAVSTDIRNRYSMNNKFADAHAFRETTVSVSQGFTVVT